MFKRSEACILLVIIISLIKKSNLYGDYEDQMKNYYDPLYRRLFTKKKPSRDAEPSNFIDLKMPGVHPEKVGKLF